MSKKNKTVDEKSVSEAASRNEEPVKAPVEEPSEPAVEETEKQPSLEELLAASQKDAEQNKDLYLRARADLENYRKRAQREKEDFGRFANENLIREILPVLDNLERAVEHVQQEGGGDEGLLQGVEMTVTMLQKALEQFGATPINSLGETFDPARHEAMGQMETEDYPPNSVAQEMQKGYMLNERLLRPALVMVAKVPQVKETPSEE